MKIGRNEFCYCGSGKKYKKCHIIHDEQINFKKGDIAYIVDWLAEQDFFQELTYNFAEEIFGPNPTLVEAEIKAITETIIFEGDYQGFTPLEYFLENASLTEDQHQKYSSWVRKSRFSLFQVLDLQPGKWVKVEDLLTGKIHVIYEHLGTLNIQNGMVIFARILPSDTDWVFAGGMMSVYPKEAEYMFKRESSNFKENPLTQKDYFKIQYGKNADNTAELTHQQSKKQLEQELQKRQIKFDIEIIDTIISKKQDKKLNDILSEISAKCSSLEEVEYLTELFLRVWQSHPKFEQEKTKPGPKEQVLISQLMHEAQHQNYTELSYELAQHQTNEFASNWLIQPQQELGNKTPEEVILEERALLGNPNKKLTYDFSLNKIPFSDPNDPASGIVQIYNQGVYLMSQKNDYYQALQLFAEVILKIENLEEIFRFYCNVGVCLIQLGEMELGKNFFEKSLKLKPDYQTAGNNLKNWQDGQVIESMRFKGKQYLFTQILEKQLINFNLDFNNNYFIKDAATFIKFVQNNIVAVSKVRRDMRLSTILLINSQFINPDPEMVVFKGGKKKIEYQNRQETQFPKVNYLHNILLSASLIKEVKDRLIITKKGKDFLELNAKGQFKLLFGIFFGKLDWGALNRENDLRADFLSSQGKILQDISFQLLSILKGLKGKTFSPLELLNQVFDQKLKKEEQFAFAMLVIALERLLVVFLLWIGIIEDNTPKKWANNPLVGLSNFSQVELTNFGLEVIESIEKSMTESIPAIFENYMKIR